MKKAFITSFIFLFGLCFSILTGQETQDVILVVQAEISASVSVTTTPMYFGELSTQSTTYTTSQISVTAMTGTIYNIALDAGQNYDGNFRRMVNQGGEGGAPPGTIFASYYLREFEDDELEWGDSDFSNTFPQGTSAGPFTGDGTSQLYTVHGWCAPVSGVILEYFQDLVTVTVHY